MAKKVAWYILWKSLIVGYDKLVWVVVYMPDMVV